MGIHGGAWRNHLLETERRIPELQQSKGVPMKALALMLFLPALVLATEGAVHDDYEAYYATLPGRLFSKQARVDFFIIEKNEISSVESADENLDIERGDDPRRRIAVRFYPASHRFSVKIGAYPFNPRQATRFPGERSGDNSLDLGTIAFLAPDRVCLENTPSSASGTAVRHRSVFLIDFSKKRPQAWQLPSLFGTCAAVRMDHGQIRFDKVEYRYEKDASGQDQGPPIGIAFHEYAIRGKKFVRTARAARNATFVEVGNVYRFRLDKPAE
jgi:hypothetical protein